MHVLTVTFFILTLYSILKENSAFLPEKAINFLSLKILDTSSSATLFVTLLGALIVRHQFVLGHHPRISYKSSFVQNDNNIWQVKILNVGLGPAIFYRLHFELETETNTQFFNIPFGEVLTGLQDAGLVHETDYKLENVSEGFTLSPKEECILFEIRKEQLSKLKHFSVVLHFQGMLGDKYCREILFIPKKIY